MIDMTFFVPSQTWPKLRGIDVYVFVPDRNVSELFGKMEIWLSSCQTNRFFFEYVYLKILGPDSSC